MHARARASKRDIFHARVAARDNVKRTGSIKQARTASAAAFRARFYLHFRAGICLSTRHTYLPPPSDRIEDDDAYVNAESPRAI